MADSSFDVVSKIDRQEVDNALNQAAKEVSQRFDFRGTNASIEWSGELGVTIKADTEERAKAALEVFKEKLVKRSISLKSLDAGEPKPSGKQYVIASTLKQGIGQDEAKKIAKLIRDEGPQGRPGADPGRPAAGVGQEEGRPAGRASRCSRAPTSTSPCSSPTTGEPRVGETQQVKPIA